MDNYLYKISTKRTNVWSSKIPKPLYVVSTDKESAKKFAVTNLKDGLSVSKITLLGLQVGGTVFVSR